MVVVCFFFNVSLFKNPASPYLHLFQIIKNLGYDRLVLQIGRGKVVPEQFRTESFALDVYRYKDSLKEDLEKADLVISHAGKVPWNPAIWVLVVTES